MPQTQPSARRSRWIGAVAVMAVALTAPAAHVASAAPSPVTSPVTPPAAPGSPVQDRGDWQVTRVDDGTWRVGWRSPTRLPVTSDRPMIVDGAQDLGAPTVAPDGRTVEVTVRSDVAPDPASLDVLLSGDRLDAAGRDPVGSAPPATVPNQAVLAADPGIAGPYSVVSSDYVLPRVKLGGMPLPVEMVGHVVEPDPSAVTGPRPLVLFLHGRHSFCYDPATRQLGGTWPCRAPMREIPSHLGYVYVQRLLASQGYATVSVRVNGINAQDFRLPDGGAGARARIVERHLDHWATIATQHQVDLSRVVLVGHSRGGEGVDRASIRIPLSAPYRIVGQILVAPTDFGTQTAPYVPTVTLLPYCDGDVIDLQGQRFTDTARDLTTDDTSLKSSVMVMGANHNFFNTEWTPAVAAAPSFDDWFGPRDGPCGRATDARLQPAEQRSVGKAYIAGAVRLFAENAEQFLPLYDGSAVTVASVGDADVRTHAIGGGRLLRKPSLSTGLSLPQGAQTQFCKGISDFAGRSDVCGRGVRDSFSTPHWPASYEQVPTRRFFEMRWTAPGQSGGMVLTRPLDLNARRLELRTIVDPQLGNVRLRVRITDSAGASADLTPVGGGLLPVLLRGEGLSKRWAQTVVVEPASATGVDLTRISRIDLIGDSTDGRVWVEDLAAAPASLAPVPERRTPLVSLTQLRLAEGAGGAKTARVPFRIDGEITRPARFVVVLAGQERGALHRFAVDLAPGQTSGSIPVDYDADSRDDFGSSITLLAAWATRDLMTDVYLGQLTVLDDDPTPPITLVPVAKTVTEGHNAQWRVHLGAAVDYDLFVGGPVVKGPGRRLAGADVPRRWLRQHAGQTGDRAPLDRLGVFLFEQIRRGDRDAVVSIPIRRDGVREPRESVTVRFDLNGKTYLRTVYVAASR